MRRKRIDWAQFLSLPALILFSIFFVYPLLKGIGMSLTDWDGMGQAEFVGLKILRIFSQMTGQCKISKPH